MTEHEKILDRVRKLLELAGSSNANEAANAMGQAQKLMARHGLEQAMLGADEREPDGEIADDLLHTDGRGSWRWLLAEQVALSNQCRAHGDNGTLRVVGKPAGRDATRYLYSYAAAEIDRLCKLALSERGNPGRTWANNFRHGAVLAIRERLREAMKLARTEMRREADLQDTMGTGVALMRVNSAIAKLEAESDATRAWERANLRLVSSGGGGGSRSDPAARAEGYRAGKSIELGGKRAGLTSGTRKALR